ncbi:MAG: squalene/phytoene synthase family protein [Azospirillum sp.]|nr:squalene/phytoene synthase family protein [Azospirillum sp.]
MPSDSTALSYCGDQLRRFDNDRYLVALFAPADRREAVFALGAFNLEIAKTREVVSEPVLGQIRLQWWRDAIEQIYQAESPAAIRRHEVIQPLAAAVAAHGLSRNHFERLIDARQADLGDQPPATLACLVNYAEVTAAPLIRLGLESLGVGDGAAHAAADHLGIAWALTGLLRAVPTHARQHRLCLPADRIAHHGVAPQRLFDLKPGDQLRSVVAEVATAARDHLATARRLVRQVPRRAIPALLVGALADLYLGAIARAGHDVFAARVQKPHPFRPLRVAWRAWLGRY